MDDLTKATQFINRKGKIDVTILDVISPSDFIVKESPSIHMSRDAARFISLEENINKYYSFVRNEHIHVPEKNEVVIVFVEGRKKYHRARVKCILDTTKGPVYSVFLLDYGVTCKVKRNWVFKIQNEFLRVPFQAVYFHLFGIEPLSLIINPMTLNASYGPADEWDSSAVAYVQEMWQGSSGVQIEIVTHDEMQKLHGQLYFQTSTKFECFNDLLTKQNYAYFNEEAAKKVMLIGDSPKKPFQETTSPVQCSVKVQSDHSEKQTQEELAALWHDCALKLLNAPECLNELNKDEKDNLVTRLSNSLQIREPLGASTVNTNLAESQGSSHSAFNEERSETIKNNGSMIYSSPLKLKTANTANSSVQLIASVKKVENSVETVNKRIRHQNIEEPCPTITKYKPSPLKNLSSVECMASDCSVTSNLHQHTSIRENPFSTRSSSSVHKTTSILKQAFKKAAQNKKTESSTETAGLKSVWDKQKCQNSSGATPKASCSTLTASTPVKHACSPISSKQEFQSSAGATPKASCPTLTASIPVKHACSPTSPKQDTIETACLKSVQENQALQSSAGATAKVSCATLGISTPVKSACSSSTSPKQDVDDSPKCNLSPIYKYVNLYRTAVVKSKSSVSETIVESNMTGNEVVKSLQSSSSSDQSGEFNSIQHKNSKLSNAVVTDKCSEENIVSSECMCIDSSPEVSKPVNMSISKVSIVRNFFRKFAPKPVTTSSAITNLSSLQTEKNKHVETCFTTSSPDSLLSGVKCVDACADKLETTSQFSLGTKTTTSPVHIIRTIGRGVPVSTIVNEKNSSISTETLHKESVQPVLHPSSECSEVDIKNKLYPAGMNIKPSNLHQTSKSCPKETENKNNDFQEFVKKLEISSGNDSQTDINVSDLDLHDVSDEAVIDETENSLSGFLSKKLSKSLSVPEESLIDPYFKTDLDFSDRSLFDEQRIPAIQIGDGTPSPILHTAEAPFIKELHECLTSLKFWGPSCIQSVVWPQVLRGRSFVAVAPPHSGKSVAYLLPILSNLLHRTAYFDLPASNGPLVFIICSSWRKIHAVNQQIQLFLKHSGKVSVLTACNDGTDATKRKIDLLNGCDILVVSPSCLLECLEQELTNFERCCHFILDDGNDIIKHHSDTLVAIMKHLIVCLKKQKRVSHLVQFGVCVEHWFQGVAAFAEKYMSQHLLSFTSFLECAIYGHVATHVQICREATKASALISLLHSSSSRKTVICTTDALSATEVHQILLNAAVYSLLAHEAMTHFDLLAVKRQWAAPHSPDNPAILIITDAAILNLNINDANCLIHFDLPEDSRLQFSYRFGCLAESFIQMENSKVTDCVCHILVTEKCHTQAAALVTILKRMKTEVPRQLITLACIQKQTNVNLDAQLCHYFKSLGSCSLAGCHKRHTVVKELDEPSIIPCQGDIQVLVNHVFDASHYCIKILRYIDPLTGNTVSKTGEYAKLSIAMQDYYSLSSKHMGLKSIEKDMLCCVKVKAGTFHRTKVLDIIETPEQMEVVLLFLDEGWVRKFAPEHLFVLSDDFCHIPPLAIEVYLCGLKPADLCSDWSPEANKFVLNLIGGQEIHGKIALCLGSTLFLDPVVIREQELAYIDDTLNLVHLGKTLKKNGYATENLQHLPLLYKACEGKVNRPAVTKRNGKCREEKSKVNWAFLELEVEEDVYVSHIESPHQLYIQRAKFAKSLDKLTVDINKQIERKAVSHCSVLQKGMYCLAPIPDDSKYYRGEIMSLSEDNGVAKAHIFFVDFGDFCTVNQSELYVLPHEFTLLPFQAIECELAGVSPPHGGWTQNATDAFFDVTRDEMNCMKILKAKAWEKTARYSGGKHHVVELFFCGVSVADFLLKEGLAVPIETPWNLGSVQCPGISSQSASVTSECEASSDDSQPPEDKDPAALMCGILALMNSNLENNKCVLKPNDILKQDRNKKPVTKAKENKVLREAKIKSFDPDSLSGNNLNLRLKTKITWWNTAEDLTVTIHLPDVTKYDLDLFHCGFKFSCTVRNKFYCFDETFYADVIPEKTEVTCLGHCVTFTFYKKVAAKWPRLIKSTEKVFYIKYDLSHLETDSDSENKPLNQKDLHNENYEIVNEEDLTASSVSSSDYECDVPTWSELCDEETVLQMT